jgi:hypothetical protein
MADIDSTIDLYGVEDFLPTMPAVSGRVALAQRLARRLTMKRGQFPWWPNDGYDIRNALLSKREPHRIAADVEEECEKDEQVEAVKATLTVEGTNATLRLLVADADGPYEFTMTISEAKVSLGPLLEAA